MGDAAVYADHLADDGAIEIAHSAAPYRRSRRALRTEPSGAALSAERRLTQRVVSDLFRPGVSRPREAHPTLATMARMTEILVSMLSPFRVCLTPNLRRQGVSYRGHWRVKWTCDPLSFSSPQHPDSALFSMVLPTVIPTLGSQAGNMAAIGTPNELTRPASPGAKRRSSRSRLMALLSQLLLWLRSSVWFRDIAQRLLGFSLPGGVASLVRRATMRPRRALPVNELPARSSGNSPEPHTRARQRPRPGDRAGSCELVGRLSRGGMGEVWLAYDRRLSRPVAVKFLCSDSEIGSSSWVTSAQRFELEAQLMASIASRHVASIHESGRWRDGTPYYVMELIDGFDLEGLVQQQGPQSAQRVTSLLSQLSEALAEIHRRGIIHRDIKPANVMIQSGAHRTDDLKLIDFGVAASKDSDLALTREGLVVGTPAYLPPEVVTAPDSVGPSSDIYALGCVAYFLLTGHPPFAGRTPTEVLFKAVYEEPSPMPDTIPTALRCIVQSCLDKDPTQRPSARQLIGELTGLSETWLAVRGVSAPLELAA